MYGYDAENRNKGFCRTVVDKCCSGDDHRTCTIYCEPVCALLYLKVTVQCLLKQLIDFAACVCVDYTLFHRNLAKRKHRGSLEPIEATEGKYATALAKGTGAIIWRTGEGGTPPRRLARPSKFIRKRLSSLSPPVASTALHTTSERLASFMPLC